METKSPSIHAEPEIGNALSKLSTEEGQVKATKDADAALSFTLGETITYDEATSNRIRHTIDKHLIPWMFFTFMIQYFDKTLLSYASVMGLIVDAKLTTSQYAWYSSLQPCPGQKGVTTY
jgi:ACS family allantoate permease-like MFS transporter